jgi:hypothetical protein
MAIEWSSRRVISKYKIKSDEPGCLVLRGSRSGVLIGAVILFLSGAGPTALGFGLIKTDIMPIGLRIFAISFGLLLFLGCIALVINWIRVKDRIIIDHSIGRITFEGPYADSPILFSEIVNVEFRKGSFSGSPVYEAFIVCGEDRKTIIDKSSDKDKIWALTQKLASITGVALIDSGSLPARTS